MPQYQKVLFQVIRFILISIEIRGFQFNNFNNLIAVIYDKRIEIMELASNQILNTRGTLTPEKKATINIIEIYDTILALEFTSQAPVIQGKIVLKPIENQYSTVPIIHIVSFNEENVGYFQGSMKVIKLENLSEIPTNYVVKFTSCQKHCLIVSEYLDVTSEYPLKKSSTFVYELDNSFLQELQETQQIRYVSVVKNFDEHSTINPFVTLAANNNSQKCLLTFSEDVKPIEIDFVFDQDRCKIVHVDARFNQESEELSVRVAFIRDQEKLSLFTYKHSVQSQFDRVFQQRENQAETEKENDTHFHYREFQEYKLSNFSYPYIAYNDLNRKIKVMTLDNSSPNFVIKMPQSRKWANITLMKITPNKQLYFLVEDVKELLLFQYDLQQANFQNRGDPLIKLSKLDLGKGISISDFWVYSKENNEMARYLPLKGQNLDLIMYYKTNPDNKLRVIYVVQNLKSNETLATSVPYFKVNENRLFYVRNQSTLESLSYKSFQKEIITHYKEIDGQIVHFIETNEKNTVWLFVQLSPSRYVLKCLQFDNEFNSTNVVEKIEIRDLCMIHEIIQAQGIDGFIEKAKDPNQKLLVIGDRIYCLESLQENNEIEAQQFSNLLGNDERQEYICYGFPQISIDMLKTLYISKSVEKKKLKNGVILPSLVSDNRIKFENQSKFNHTRDIELSFLLTDQEQNSLKQEKHAIFRFNTLLKTFQILDVKGKVIHYGSFDETFKEEHGKIVAQSSKGKMFAAFDQINSRITIFELQIDLMDLSQVKLVQYAQYEIDKFLISKNRKKKNRLGGYIIESVQKKAKIDQIIKAQFQVNNKGDLLIFIKNFESKQNEAILYKFTSQPIKINFKHEEVDAANQLQRLKNCSISEQYVIGWFENACYLYPLVGSKPIQQEQQLIHKLSLSFDPFDGHNFIEVLHLENEQDLNYCSKELFLCRVENSLKSHMIIIWDQRSSTEECSIDCESQSLIMTDEIGHAYILDSQNGLMELTQESGGCKNLGFRYLIDFSSDKTKQYHQDWNLRGQKVKMFRERNMNTEILETIEDTVTCPKLCYNKKYLQYIMIGGDLALPYSFFQLIVNERIYQMKQSSYGKQKAYIQNFENLISSISTDSFCYQIRNGSIFHCLSSSFREIQLFINIIGNKDPALLSMLLIQNEDLKTPLELALENNNPRCINLFMESMSLYCQDSFGKSTNLFKNNFAKLIDYVAFKNFIETTFYRSQQFQQITSFSSNDTERLDSKGIMKSHTTVARDSKFNETFQDPNHLNERNVDVSSIRADWILKTPEGVQFLQDLSQSDQMELFALESIQTIVLFQWNEYKRIIVKNLFYPFLVYFMAFIFSITYSYQQTEQGSVKDRNNISNIIIICIFVMPLQVYFLSIEIRQFMNQRSNYFREFWNILDVCQLVAAFFTSILMLTNRADSDSQYINIIGSVTVIALYLKFFYFLRIFESSAPYIRMIVQMTYDIRVFLYIFMLTVVGFGNGLYLLSLNNPEGDDRFIPNMIMGVLFVYRMALGDFDTEKFGQEHIWLVWVIFMISTLLIMIILLNLLIAIMGDTFGKVKETEEQSRIREYLQLILDNDFLVNRQELFKNVKFIISITLEKDSKSSTNQLIQDPMSLQNQQLNSQLFETLTQKIEKMQKKQEELQDLIYRQIQRQEVHDLHQNSEEDNEFKHKRSTVEYRSSK